MTSVKEVLMPYTLGIKPDSLTIYLWRDADFDSVLTRRNDAGEEADWGTSDVRLVFPETDPEVTWPAVVTGPNATFQVDKAVTNDRSHRDRVELWVGDQCWASGRVNKKGDVA